MSIQRLIAAALLLTVAWAPLIADDLSSADATAARAIPYLISEGEQWMDQRGCVSCHQVPAMLWSLGAARENGLTVSAESIDQWKAWSVQPVNFVKPEQKNDINVAKTLTANLDTMAGLLLAIDGDLESKWRKQFVDALCVEQSDDGSWNPCGQLPAQKRPKQETAQATTLWVTLALLKDTDANFDRRAAIAFADRNPAARSTEWFAVRLLVAAELGEKNTADRRKALLDLQQKNGGWGWITDQPSDALATGIALYALAKTGDSNVPSVQRGRAFLTDTIQDDGYWKVPGTKASAKGKPTETSNYWGTAWAVVGLLESN